MIIINITEFKSNIREFQGEKLPKTEDLERNMKTSWDFICGPRASIWTEWTKNSALENKNAFGSNLAPRAFPSLMSGAPPIFEGNALWEEVDSAVEILFAAFMRLTALGA